MIHERPENCTGCELCKTRTQVVQSVLPDGLELVLIGEGPGEEEDRLGIPFVGRAGRLLNTVLEEVGIDREAIGIVNVVGCRPPDNRKPTPKEVKACWSFVEKELKQLKPKLLVPMGDTAMKKILPGIGTITKIRGQMFRSEEYNCTVIPTLHPAYVLRNEIELRPKFREDLRKASAFLRGALDQKRAPVDYCLVETQEQFDWLIQQLNEQSEWACDAETTGYDWQKDEVFMVSFSWQEQTAVFIDFRNEFFTKNHDYVWKKLGEVFANDSKKIFHNGSFDIEFFMMKGCYINNYYFDTLLAHHLVDENAFHGLEVLAAEYTDMGGYEIPLLQYVKQNKIANYADIPTDILYTYSPADADVTFRSYKKLLPLIYEQNLDKVMFTITMPAQVLLIMTEFWGVSVDVPYLKRTLVKYTKLIQEQEDIIKTTPQVIEYEQERKDRIWKEFKLKYNSGAAITKKKFPTFNSYMQSRKEKDLKYSFNSNSHLQLKELLIDKMKLPIIKYTKRGKKVTTNPSLDAEVLEIYATKHKHAFCAALSRVSTLNHLKSTFLDGIKERLDEYNKVHTDYRVWGTKTGRISSKDPNLNNIPRTGTADDIKDIFCADPGEWMMEIDGSQMEFRTWINYSEDLQAIHDLEVGIDIHKLMAAAGKGVAIPRGDITYDMFKELVKDVTKEERQNAKLVVFGIMYGRGAESVAEQLGISKKDAQYIIDQFFERYPKARMWLLRQHTRARKEGYVANLFGRRRRLPNINSRDQGLKADAERQAQNSPIQGGASDIVMRAGIRINQWIWENNIKARMVLTVYDSLIFTIADEHLEQVAKKVFKEMHTPPEDVKIVVPLDAEMKIGKNWGSLLEVNPEKEEWESVYFKIKDHIIMTGQKKKL
ncbi:MAG: DNA polymerase [Methanogenium sp.]|jgi:DNA polymerase-1